MPRATHWTGTWSSSKVFDADRSEAQGRRAARWCEEVRAEAERGRRRRFHQLPSTPSSGAVHRLLRASRRGVRAAATTEPCSAPTRCDDEVGQDLPLEGAGITTSAAPRWPQPPRTKADRRLTQPVRQCGQVEVEEVAAAGRDERNATSWWDSDLLASSGVEARATEGPALGARACSSSASPRRSQGPRFREQARARPSTAISGRGTRGRPSQALSQLVARRVGGTGPRPRGRACAGLVGKSRCRSGKVQ